MADTTGPLSEVAVAVMAAGLLDEFRVTSLDGTDPMSRFLAREFGYIRDEVLQVYPWHPAKKRASLTAVVSAPAFGWDYAYNLPADCLRLLPLRVDGKIEGAEISYELENGQILTNHEGPLYVRYIQKLSDISKWRPLMARVLACRIAMYGATRITGKLSYFQKAQEEYQRSMFEATHADSLERGTSETYAQGGNVFTARGLSYEGA